VTETVLEAPVAKPRSRLRRWSFRLFVALAVMLPVAGGVFTFVYLDSYQSNVGELSFRNPVKIPPVLEPTVDANGTKRFQLSLQTGTTEFLPGKPAQGWGANGSYLGPRLRAARGDEVAVDVVNRLPEQTTVHWHGMRLPAKMDGGPHQMINQGATWSPNWTIDQPAASLWYHPHLHGRTAEHVYRGVAGMWLIDDDESARLALPKEYGVDDIPLVVQDKAFNDDGSLDLSPGLMTSDMGVLGDEILVNGTFDPYFEVSTTRVRMRVLNAATARSFNVGFTDNRRFSVIGNDGGLLGAPVSVDRLRLSPGERAEIVAEFRPSEEVILRSFPAGDAGGWPSDRFNGADDEFDLMKLIAKPSLTPSPPVPSVLSSTPEINAPSGAVERKFTLGGATEINDKRMDMSRIDEVIAAGTTEIWTIRGTGSPHGLHIHEVAFRVLEVNGGPPWVYARGRKDTVYVPPSATIRLAVEFGSHVDPTTPYMYHCHVLRHEDNGMMGQFVLVQPGTEAQTPRQVSHSGH
jgi:suppressor of ftsI